MSRETHIWHPMTQHRIFPVMDHVERAKGAYLYTKDGRKVLDGISSWWLNTHGHCHPKIVQAVQEQAGKLDQVIFAGFTHDPAVKLTGKLLEIVHRSLGNHLQYAFYSDSGSTAIEVALKMAVGYYEHTGQPRKKIVALEGGYHGDTFGAMSTGKRGVFNKLYEPYLFGVVFLPLDRAEEEFARLLETEGPNIAALILEPLVQGAAGMQVYSPGVLKALHDLCRIHGVLLIADEVMTGFGRTGSMFACGQAGISPDLLCLSKGITGGFLPMGVTLAGADIYEAFYHEDRSKTFFHSTSFTGNPLSCVAALAALEIWEDEPVSERLRMIESCHEKAAARFRKHPQISDVRTKGTILAMDVIDPNPGYLSTLGPELYRFYMQNDVLLRPIGNCVYVLPPYCITEEELERIYNVITRSLEHIRNGREEQAA